jgi:DNA-binding protein H-NS
MPVRSFARMTIEALLELRDEVMAQLAKRRAQLEAQIKQLDGGAVAQRRGRSPGTRRHALRKVPPKYRGPKGETWAGRGVAPRWLVELMKQGRKKEEFAIAGAVAAKKKRLVKRGRRRKKK